MKISNPEYLEKVRELSEEEQERLLSRMAGKLPRRLEKDKLTREEAMAIQMELEDEQLQEWRARMHELKAKSKSREKTKAVNAEKKVDASTQAEAAEAEVPVKKPSKTGKRS